ncbi:MAG TPA: prolipoprotein diacylglyceryl transferase family protein, partial [Rhodothermales bacterium]|nr:prolipoprotein diacylglyceryl transferase family protein [Rhodothermales bacterium]
IGPDMQPVEVISYTTDRAQVLGFPADICAGANGVYPTMLYEFAVCALLAGALWLLRKHPYRAGWLFSIYLLFTGVERFVIETIRLNPDVIWGLSQAQLISIVMFAAGLVGLALTTRRAAAPPAAPAAAPAPAPPVATAA